MMSDGWIKTERGWAKRYGPPREPVRMGNYPCPHISSDRMPLTEHVNGKYYDSKSEYRAVTKAEGYIEVGNDPARFKAGQKATTDTRKTDEAIHRAIAQYT